MNIYDILDLDRFIKTSRILVYSNFGKSDKETNIDPLQNLSENELSEMDKCLTQSECKNIFKKFRKKQRNKTTGQIRYVISDALFLSFIEELNARLVSNLLSKLVSEGYIESAFDDKSNDFIFWVNENKNEEN